MDVRRILIVLNPGAAHGEALNDLPVVEELLGETGIEYEIVKTQRRLHAIDLAQKAAASGVDVMVAAGGDGTVNEVINGLMLAKSSGISVPALGILPIGRGNDFAYGVNVPHDKKRAIDIIQAGHEKKIDVGYLEGGDFPDGRYFGNGVGIGFETIVALEAMKMKRLKGFIGYLVGAIKTMSNYYHAPLLKLTYPGADRAERALMISIMNGRRAGGAFYMAPKAINDDGYFDVVVAGEPKRRQMIVLLIQYMRGTQERSRFIRSERVEEIEIEALDGTLVVHADGEIICAEGQHLSMKCIPKALTMLCSGE